MIFVLFMAARILGKSDTFGERAGYVYHSQVRLPTFSDPPFDQLLVSRALIFCVDQIIRTNQVYGCYVPGKHGKLQVPESKIRVREFRNHLFIPKVYTNPQV